LSQGWTGDCSGKAEVRGREARISIAVNQTNVSVSLDRPPKVQGKGANQGTACADKLIFTSLSG